MRESQIDSIAAFHQLIRDHWNGIYVYRGEESDKYKLLPKFGRDQEKSVENDSEIERALLNDFKRTAIPHLTYNPTNNWDWLAIAQHHGLHTRLLDWTLNPLAAAFFAVHKNSPGDSILYIFDSRDLLDVDEVVPPFDIKEVRLFYPRHVTRRISAQSGLFTIHPEPSKPFNTDSLERITINNSCKNEFDLVLSTYNIDDYTMFPDLDGLVRVINNEWIR